jgi:hypothetical protein
MKRSLPIVLLLSTTSIFAFSCDKAVSALGGGKAKECDNVAKVANAAIDEMHRLEKEMHGEAHDAEALAKDANKFVEVMEKAAKDIRAVGVSDEGLKTHVDAYIAMLDAAAAATKGMIAELEKAGDLTEEKIKAADKEVMAALEALGKACGDQSPDCAKIGDVMQTLSSKNTSEELGGALSELEKLDLDDDDVKQKKLAFIEAGRKDLELLAIAERLDESMKKVDDAVANEDQLVANLNQYCNY